jgi:anthranilate phosphoribosyltransferase
MAFEALSYVARPLDEDRERSALSAPPESLREALYRVAVGGPLEKGLVRQGFLDLLDVDPRSRDGYLGALMSGIMARGPVEDEVVEVLEAALALDAIRPDAVLPTPATPCVVLAGSGKKGVKAFNVSTLSALVAAAAGVHVVKIGSKATSSVMGSRDLVHRLGLPEVLQSADVLAFVQQHRFAFVPVEDGIPLVDSMYGGRFHVLSPFSFGLAALVSPVRGDVLVYGLAHPDVGLAARVLRRFGVHRALVVASRSAGGYFTDEFGLGERSWTCELRGGAVSEPTEYDLEAEALPGRLAQSARHQVIPPSSGDEALRWAVDLLRGHGPEDRARIVALNAGLYLAAAGTASDLADGYDRAMAVLGTGLAYEKMAEMREAAQCAGRK